MGKTGSGRGTLPPNLTRGLILKFSKLTWLAFAMVPCLGWAAPCSKLQLRGYVYKNTQEGEDRYFNKMDGIRLSVKCLPPAVKPEEVVERLSKESSVRNTTGDAVYFEFDDAGQFRRVYVITRRPVLQLTFTTKHKRRAALDDTQGLIEATFKSAKGLAVGR